jgi:hypothetical protein
LQAFKYIKTLPFMSLSQYLLSLDNGAMKIEL